MGTKQRVPNEENLTKIYAVKTEAAAIAAPTAPSASYSQAEAASMKTSVDALRAAVKAAGITA